MSIFYRLIGYFSGERTLDSRVIALEKTVAEMEKTIVSLADYVNSLHYLVSIMMLERASNKISMNEVSQDFVNKNKIDRNTN